MPGRTPLATGPNFGLSDYGALTRSTPFISWECPGKLQM
jgi:hypothetical protein